VYPEPFETIGAKVGNGASSPIRHVVSHRLQSADSGHWLSGWRRTGCDPKPDGDILFCQRIEDEVGTFRHPDPWHDADFVAQRRIVFEKEPVLRTRFFQAVTPLRVGRINFRATAASETLADGNGEIDQASPARARLS